MCTGVKFIDDKGNMYFGRNLDWCFDFGQNVIITPRNYSHKYEYLGDMKNKYALIGMGISFEGIPLYFDCGNEAGLACGGLNFPGYAQYEHDAVEGKTCIASYEVPLWVCSQFSTVDEAEAALKNVAITDKPVNEKLGASMLHWMIGDKDRTIVIEYTKNGMEIFDDGTDTLTNQPGFDFHRENLRNYLAMSNKWPEPVMWREQKLTPFGSGACMRGIPGDYYSPSRFVRVAYINANYPVQTGEAANVARMFHTLGGVAMVDGCAIMNDQGHAERTTYTGCFSPYYMNYYYSTYEDPAIRYVTIQDYDADADAIIEVLDKDARYGRINAETDMPRPIHYSNQEGAKIPEVG